MALHPNFPRSPYADLVPGERWFPAAEELRSTAYEKLLPPLVAKVISLLIAWSFFHKLYERDSALARNILVIASNIIVLDHLRADFDGPRIFFNDPSFGEYQEG